MKKQLLADIFEGTNEEEVLEEIEQEAKEYTKTKSVSK